YGDVGFGFSQSLFEVVDVVDGEFAPGGADFAAVGIESHDDLEPLAVEAAVRNKGGAEVSNADENDADAAVGAQNAFKIFAQVFDVVAEAGNTELAEISQIFAHLGAIDTEEVG